MAVLQQAMFMVGSNIPVFSYSSDVVTLPAACSWRAGAYSQISQRWVILGNDGASPSQGAHSDDNGTNWSTITLPSANNWYGAASDSTGSFIGIKTGSGVNGYGSTGSWSAGTVIPKVMNGSITNNGTSVLAISETNPPTAYTSSGAGTWGAANNLPTASTSWGTIAGINTPTTITIATEGASPYSIMRNTDNQGLTWVSDSVGATGILLVGANGTGNVGVSPRFMMVARGTNTCYTSDDGDTWTTQATLPITASWLQPVYCLNCWLVFREGSNKVLSTEDAGATWTEHTLPVTLGSGGTSSLVHPIHTNGQLAQTIVPLPGTATALRVLTG